MMWKIRLIPGEFPNAYNQNKPTPSKLVLFAIPTTEERNSKKMERSIDLQLYTFNIDGRKYSNRNWTHQIDFTGYEGKNVHFEIDKFAQFQSPKNMRQSGTSEQLFIEIRMQHTLGGAKE